MKMKKNNNNKMYQNFDCNQINILMNLEIIGEEDKTKKIISIS